MVVLKKTSTSTATTTFLLPISATATACASLDREVGDLNPCKKDSQSQSQSQSLVLQQNPSHVLQSQRKKKVRRRVHGSKFYQGRVLNMAEARKEIVTALKIHRATMKANSQKHPSSPQVPPLPHLHHHHHHHNHPLLPPPEQQQQQKQATTDQESQREVKSRRINRIYAPNSISASYTIDFPKSISYRHHHHSSINSDNDPRKQQLLLHDLRSSTTTSSSISSCASSSSFSSPTTNTSTSTTVASLGGLTPEQICKTSLHPVMDDEKMVEIRLIGEQHAMEWNDNLNMASALAWWCKFVGEHDDRNSGECLKDFCRIDEHEQGTGHEQVPSFICHDYSNAEICYFPWL